MLRRDSDNFRPISQVGIPRVNGTGALSMFDGNYLAFPHSIGCNGTPIILNNACVSWLHLSYRFMFAGARAYIGSLVEIYDSEAFAVTTRLFGKHFEKSLPHALWSSQNDAFGDSVRRPYVVTGVYTQRLRSQNQDIRSIVLKKLTDAKLYWMGELAKNSLSEQEARHLREVVGYYRSEIQRISRFRPNNPN